MMWCTWRRCCLFIIALLAVLVGCNSRRQTTEIPESTEQTAVTDEGRHEQPVVGAADSANAFSSPTISTSLTRQRQLMSRRLLEPKNDGWTSEAIASTVASRLNDLAATLLLPPDARREKQQLLVDENLHSTDLRPQNLASSYKTSTVQVWRPRSFSSDSYKGLDGFSNAIETFIRSLDTSSQVEAHFKVVQIEQDRETVHAKVLVEFSVTSVSSAARQINATWECDWKQVDPGSLLLSALRVTEYEETVVEHPTGKWFVDRTHAVVGNDPVLWKQLSTGYHDWLQRIERVQRFDTSVRSGLAIGDVNGDGLDDVYLCQPPGLPNRLFVHNKDGTATERAEGYGIDWMDQTSAALFCDLDNDSDQDLVLGTHVGLVLMQNDGQGVFKLVSTLALDYDVQSLSSADFDNDGRLDLFACVYRTTDISRQSFLYRDAVGGGENRLFRNEISATEWKFSDVTSDVGLDDGADRYSWAASWEDFDNDGDQDLYVANDFGRNYFYENRDGTFVDIAEQAGVLDIGSGMSVSWADHNRDGLMDLYVGNMFSSAGRRITSQQKFRPKEATEIREIYQRLAKGNSLFTNLGDGNFVETGQQAGVELGRWSWSSLFVDLNNDGWEDLFVANGYMTTPDAGDL